MAFTFLKVVNNMEIGASLYDEPGAAEVSKIMAAEILSRGGIAKPGIPPRGDLERKLQECVDRMTGQATGSTGTGRVPCSS